MTYRVLILEDDPMVAAIDRQYVESDRHFQVVQVCKSGGQALEYLAHQDVELIVLDYYTPEMNGQEFLDHLHAMGRAPAVIMVTSASDTDIVRSLLSRGVQDYLVKPFEFARFRQALDKFLQRQKLLSNSGGMDQRAIDQLLQSQDGEEAAPQLSKGLNGATLRLIQDFLARSQGQEPEPGEAVPNLRQARSLMEVLGELEALEQDVLAGVPYDLCAVRLEGAASALAEITGLDTPEEVLNRIFASFCIGK